MKKLLKKEVNEKLINTIPLLFSIIFLLFSFLCDSRVSVILGVEDFSHNETVQVSCMTFLCLYSLIHSVKYFFEFINRILENRKIKETIKEFEENA